MKHIATASFLAIALSMTACSPTDNMRPHVGDDDTASNPAAGTRPADDPNLMTVEGRISDGVECPVLTTPDGDVWSLSGDRGAFASGDYVEIEGEQADASFCMQGKGTLIIDSIEAKDPPARDRDPARAGGIPVTQDYVLGHWTAKGLGSSCSKPDFHISRNRNGGTIIETRVNGVPATGYVDVGDSPAFQWDEGIPTLPIETRGPDGLAVMPGDGRTITLAGHDIAGDGVVFIKCAEKFVGG